MIIQYVHLCLFFVRLCACIYASAFHQDLLRSSLPTKRLCICIIEPLSLQSPHCSSASVSALLDTRHSTVRDILSIPHISLFSHLPLSQSVSHRHTNSGYLVCLRSSSAIAKKARNETGYGDPGDPLPFSFSLPYSLLHHCPETLPFLPTYHHTLLTPT